MTLYLQIGDIKDLEPCTKCLLRNTIHDPFKTFLFLSANKYNDDKGGKNNTKPANENPSSLTRLFLTCVAPGLCLCDCHKPQASKTAGSMWKKLHYTEIYRDRAAFVLCSEWKWIMAVWHCLGSSKFTRLGQFGWQQARKSAIKILVWWIWSIE